MLLKVCSNHVQTQISATEDKSESCQLCAKQGINQIYLPLTVGFHQVF